ncbi:hypothetical protein DFH11DRAFT_218131 [Phellopilus nigrolimitatus]|nr:hypothetical protein DFH11DRAFT_218131 [Phellopilus nigrolimitatus]
MVEKLDEDTLVLTLNSLLTGLGIPIALKNPFDLTPSLILATFESMLRTRLPVSAETRKSATYPARVEAMKIFIGVLEDDVLGVDVGLEEIDPRRLAEGQHEEVVYVAEILCWLGKKMNYISGDGLSVGNIALPREAIRRSENAKPPPSPSLHSTVSTSHDSSLLMHTTRSFDESQTTMSVHDESEDDALPNFDDGSRTISRVRNVDDFPQSRMRRRQSPLRHNSEADSVEDHIDDSFCHCPPDMSDCSTVIPPLRSTGHLEKIDFDSELKSYEAWKEETSLRSQSLTHNVGTIKPRLSGAHLRTPPRNKTETQSTHGIVTRHTSPSQHTLALLNERARLLSELSKFKRWQG